MLDLGMYVILCFYATHLTSRAVCRQLIHIWYMFYFHIFLTDSSSRPCCPCWQWSSAKTVNKDQLKTEPKKVRVSLQSLLQVIYGSMKKNTWSIDGYLGKILGWEGDCLILTCRPLEIEASVSESIVSHLCAWNCVVMISAMNFSDKKITVNRVDKRYDRAHLPRFYIFL